MALGNLMSLPSNLKNVILKLNNKTNDPYPVDDDPLWRSKLISWGVPFDWYGPMFYYVVYGCSPGGFLTAVLANDLMAAVAASHPVNTVVGIKDLCGWISNELPKQCFGNYDVVDAWRQLSNEERINILCNHGLLCSREELVMHRLQQPATNI
jgi:hypothetical protein